MSCEPQAVRRSDHVAHPERSHTQSGYADDEADYGETFVPGGIGQCQVVLVGAGAVQYLTHKAQDVDGGYHDGGAG